MAEDTSGNTILREPAQWKCTWTCHQIHFVWKFKGKMAEDHLRGHRFVRACAVEMHMDISQKPFCVKLTRKCWTPRIPHRALTLIVRTPHCGHTVWGKMTHEFPTCTPNTDICPFFLLFMTSRDCPACQARRVSGVSWRPIRSWPRNRRATRAWRGVTARGCLRGRGVLGMNTWEISWRYKTY